LFKQQTSTFS